MVKTIDTSHKFNEEHEFKQVHIYSIEFNVTLAKTYRRSWMKKKNRNQKIILFTIKYTRENVGFLIVE